MIEERAYFRYTTKFRCLVICIVRFCASLFSLSGSWLTFVYRSRHPAWNDHEIQCSVFRPSNKTRDRVLMTCAREIGITPRIRQISGTRFIPATFSKPGSSEGHINQYAIWPITWIHGSINAIRLPDLLRPPTQPQSLQETAKTEIVEIKLNEEEKELLNKSAAAVKDVMNVLDGMKLF